MTEYFDRVKGGISLYCDSDDGRLPDVRFVLGRFGEDPQKLMRAFWQEHKNESFTIALVFSYGSTPRPELCTKQSLSAALKVTEIEVNGEVERQWKVACSTVGVPWPHKVAA